MVDSIKKNENTYEDIFFNAPNGLCSYFFDGETLKPIHHNKTFYEIMGFSDEMDDVIEERVGFYNFHPDNLEETKAKTLDILKSGGRTNFKYRMFNQKKQMYVTVDASLFVRKNDDGTAFMYAIYEDVTELESNRQLVYDEMAQFNNVERTMNKMEANLVGTVRYNLTEDYVIEHNPGGMPVPTVEDRVSVDAFGAIITPTAIGPGAPEKFAAKFKRKYLLEAKANGEIVKHEYKRHGKDGSVMWAKTIAVFADSPKDNNEYALVYTYDITDQKQQENIIDHIINTNFDFVAIIDTASENYMAKIMEQSYGLLGNVEEPEQYEDTSHFPYMEGMKYFVEHNCVEKERDEIINAMSIDTIIENLKKDKLYSCSYILLENGERRNKIWQFSYFNEDHTKIIYSRSDATEIFRAEMEAKAALSVAIQKANEANKAKSTFLSRMSHDMRTPMNSVLNFAEIGISEKTADEKNECFERIKESGNYLLGLINDVLDVGRIEEGRISLKLEPYYYDDFEKSMKNMLRSKANEKDVNFVIKKEIMGKYGCMFDKLRLQQIFFNLIGNAIKFTNKGGLVELIVSSDEEVLDGKISYTFVVKDNGVGISQEFINHKMFNPFEQEENTAENMERGTGLGLTIVQKLVESMDGTISCESQLGKGTTFTVKLNPPVALEDDYKNDKKNISLDVLRGKTVLLCEDHPLNIKIAVKLLEKKDIKVDVAENGEIGLSMFNSSAKGYYDAVLMDIRMPIMDGLEVASKIRSSNHFDGRTIPIIAMSANAFERDINKSLEVGMNAHIAKPIDIGVLYETLAYYITNRK